jgi:hypothetical protein
MGLAFCLVRTKGLTGLARFPIRIHRFRAMGKRMVAGNTSKRRPPDVVIHFDHALRHPCLLDRLVRSICAWVGASSFGETEVPTR